MELEHNRRLDAFDRVIEFGNDHEITPAIPRVTALYTQVGTVATQMRAYAATQDGGKSSLHAGVDLREQLVREVKALMRPINEVARSLDKEEHPEVAAKFRMPSKGGYEGVISRARSFVDALADAEVKTLFTDRSLEATIDTELTAKTDELVAASEMKHSGFVLQVGSTAAIKQLSRDGLKALRELNAILRRVYADDPMLLAAWAAARKVERPPRRNQSAFAEDPQPLVTAATVEDPSESEAGLPAGEPELAVA